MTFELYFLYCRTFTDIPKVGEDPFGPPSDDDDGNVEEMNLQPEDPFGPPSDFPTNPNDNRLFVSYLTVVARRSCRPATRETHCLSHTASERVVFVRQN